MGIQRKEWRKPRREKPGARTGRKSGRYPPSQRTHRETRPNLSCALRCERGIGFAQEANTEAPMPRRQAVWFLPCKNQIAFVCMAVRIFLSSGYSILLTYESNCLCEYGNESEPSRALRWESRIGLPRNDHTEASRPRRLAVWFLLCKHQIAFVRVALRVRVRVHILKEIVMARKPLRMSVWLWKTNIDSARKQHVASPESQLQPTWGQLQLKRPPPIPENTGPRRSVS